MSDIEKISRRAFLKQTAAIAGATFIADKIYLEKESDMPMTSSPVLIEAKTWSELPGALKEYEALIDREQNGVSRIFGYASIIQNHENEKPTGSKNIPNESARLLGMEVAMNVLAAGEYEFRGTRGTYKNEEGKEKAFANIGIYAGLEPATTMDGFADGKNITASRDDRRVSLKAYIKRELGTPPAGITLDDLFDDKAAAKFAALKGTPTDEFGMYKFQVVNTKIDKDGKAVDVPAVSVSTNEKSKFAAIGLTPMQTAQLILDGQGYRRHNGQAMIGGAALDYFKQSVVDVAKKNGLKQQRLAAIDAAVDQLAGIYTQAEIIFEKNIPDKQKNDEISALIDAHAEGLKGVRSPYFKQGENVNPRDPVSDADKALPQNQMPKTAAEKLRRIKKLQEEGKTTRSL